MRTAILYALVPCLALGGCSWAPYPSPYHYGRAGHPQVYQPVVYPQAPCSCPAGPPVAFYNPNMPIMVEPPPYPAAQPPYLVAQPPQFTNQVPPVPRSALDGNMFRNSGAPGYSGTP